jgi:galactonate dehydratase
MKITEIRTFLVGRCLLVRVYTDAGIIGNGEAGLWAHQRPVETFIRDFADYFVGQDPLRIEHHHQVISRQYHFTGAAISAALSAIDIALWDILGKSVDLPVYQLLGGKCRDKVRVYASVGGNSLDAVADSAKGAVDAGFTAVRLYPFFPDFEKATSAKLISDAVKMTAVTRETIGDDIDIGIEIHRNLAPSVAISLATAIEPFRLMYYEDPLVPESEEALEYLAAHIDIPMALGERSHDIFQFVELINRQVASFIRVDLSLAGGFTQVKKIAAIAESALVEVFPHLVGSPVSGAAFAHLAAAIPNYALMESNPPSEMGSAIVDAPFVEKDGYREVPDRPGIGVEIDEEACSRFPYTPVPIEGFFHADGSVAH